MTHTEIIQKTVEYYAADTSRRAVRGTGCCSYLTKDGRYCGHAMWIRPGMRQACTDSRSGRTAYDIIKKFGDEIHLPEARGKADDFWSDIQELHDGNHNWTKNALSAQGRKEVERLFELWAD